ncbi:MAG: toprim domain-containing protein [Bacteroidota bacterium]
MNSQQAKQIDFPDLLARLGYHPVKVCKGGRELWYMSPFRKDRTPSFHTSYLGGKWIWKDFGDEGGNVIDFVIRHEEIPFKEALAYLRKIYLGNRSQIKGRAGTSIQLPLTRLSFQQQSEVQSFAPEGERELEFLEAHEIQNPLILQYLVCERKIPSELAKQYLWEVKYRNKSKGRDFFAFGMENESNGYEIRSASDQYPFKSALIKRDISIIKGREGSSCSISIFEGMTDFLSLLALKQSRRLQGDSIVMHSVSSYQRTKAYLQGKCYQEVLTYLDNDKTGEKYTTRFREDLPTLDVWPQNHLYAHYRDLNEALKARATKSSSEMRFQL